MKKHLLKMLAAILMSSFVFCTLSPTVVQAWPSTVNTEGNHQLLSDFAVETTNLTSDERRIVKLGSVAPDRYFKYGDGYPSLHGFENYIDAFTYISRKADTITPSTSFTYYPTKSTYVQQIDSALYVLSQNWSSYLEGKTVSSRNIRLYVLGMSLHLASDVYAHRAYVYVSSQSAWIPVTHYITPENSSYFDQISADDRYACPNRFELSKWVSRYTVEKWINGTVRDYNLFKFYRDDFRLDKLYSYSNYQSLLSPMSIND